MQDAVDELVAHIRETRELSPALVRVYRFHKANLQVLDFLVNELRAERASGWNKTSLGNLWHYARWVLNRKNRVPGECFAMPNNLFPAYGRIIAILHPNLNGFYEMSKCTIDAEIGVKLEAAGNQRGYTRRLQWVDGTAIEDGWRPSVLHEPKTVGRRKPINRAS
jgi:hypothetical protein